MIKFFENFFECCRLVFLILLFVLCLGGPLTLSCEVSPLFSGLYIITIPLCYAILMFIVDKYEF